MVVFIPIYFNHGLDRYNKLGAFKAQKNTQENQQQFKIMIYKTWNPELRSDEICGHT